MRATGRRNIRTTAGQEAVESGQPDRGKGHKDADVLSGVSLASSQLPPTDDTPRHGTAKWEQGEHQAAGDQESGQSAGGALPLGQLVNSGKPSAANGQLAQPRQPSPTCRDIMSEDPVCCLPIDPVDVVARLMMTEDVGSLPVVNDLNEFRLVGIVTDRDLAMKVVAEGQDPTVVTAEEVMTRDPVTCQADTDIQTALDAMAEHQVRRIPVVDEDQRLIGIIAQADIAARLAEPEQTARVVGEISKSSPSHETPHVLSMGVQMEQTQHFRDRPEQQATPRMAEAASTSRQNRQAESSKEGQKERGGQKKKSEPRTRPALSKQANVGKKSSARQPSRTAAAKTGGNKDEKTTSRSPGTRSTATNKANRTQSRRTTNNNPKQQNKERSRSTR